MNTNYDVIVVGHGLAGTALAWHLRWMGMHTLVLDRETPSTASKVAAGLITPITGQKLISSWRFSELWTAAKTFYQRVEELTRKQFFRELPMVRLFTDKEEASLFESRKAKGSLDGYVRDLSQPLNPDWFDSPFGGFEMLPGGQLNVLAYLEASREFFCNQGDYLSCDLDVSRDFELDSKGVKLPQWGVRSDRLIFCQGIDSVRNPWFRDVEFKPAKGEVLTVQIPRLAEARVIHCGVWLAPFKDDLFLAGSTYDWGDLDSDPTIQGRQEIVSQLQRFLRLPFEVVSQTAAVRPIHRNQYPVIGVHPENKRIAFFNGLGSKGSLYAPLFAHQLAAHLASGCAIEPEVDLNRKTRWNSNPVANSQFASDPTGKTRHVERQGTRPLTQHAQDCVRETLNEGEIAIDATMGNGHDTLFLARHVGPKGTVFAFDIQRKALDKTARLLEVQNLTNVRLLLQNHEELLNCIPREYHGLIGAVMFNLGYLPGGNKDLTTQEASTSSAILQATNLLRDEGVITIVAYTGHDGGAREAVSVERLLDSFSMKEFEINRIECQPGRASGPKMFLVKRHRRTT